MNWEWLRAKLNEMAESDNEEVKAFLDAQVIAFVGSDGSIPVHLSQSLLDGELILLPLEEKKED